MKYVLRFVKKIVYQKKIPTLHSSATYKGRRRSECLRSPHKVSIRETPQVLVSATVHEFDSTSIAVQNLSLLIILGFSLQARREDKDGGEDSASRCSVLHANHAVRRAPRWTIA